MPPEHVVSLQSSPLWAPVMYLSLRRARAESSKTKPTTGMLSSKRVVHFGAISVRDLSRPRLFCRPLLSTPACDLSSFNSQDQYEITALAHSVCLTGGEKKMHFWSFLHSVCNEGRIIHSPGWFGHIPSVIFPVWPIAVVWPGGNPLIAVLLSWLPLQHYSEPPSIGNMCSTGCVNAL